MDMDKLGWFTFGSQNLMEYAPSQYSAGDLLRGHIVRKLDAEFEATHYYPQNRRKPIEEGTFQTMEEAKAFIEDCVERSSQ